MEKRGGAKAIFCALVAMFILQFSCLVVGVDIVFYDNLQSCSGVSLGCSAISNLICCTLPDPTQYGSVIVATSNPGTCNCIGVTFFSDSACATPEGTGVGNTCYQTRTVTIGGNWAYSCKRRRSLFSEPDCNTSGNCRGKMNPNVVGFTGDGMKGSWSLTSSNATDLYLQLKSVDDAEKVDWLKSLGATYKVLTPKA